MVCDVPTLAGPRERWDLARFAESSLAEEAFVYGTKASGRMGRFQPRMLSCHSHIWRPIITCLPPASSGLIGGLLAGVDLILSSSALHLP